MKGKKHIDKILLMLSVKAATQKYYKRQVYKPLAKEDFYRITVVKDFIKFTEKFAVFFLLGFSLQI